MINSKIEAIEERFAIGEINTNIYQKFRDNYTKEQADLEYGLDNSSISSSNLNLAIEKALTISSKLSNLWQSGDLIQKKKIQNLIFPSGIGYDKSGGKVQTKRVNSIFSSIPLLAKGLSETKNGGPVNFNKFSVLVTSAGLNILTKLRFEKRKLQLINSFKIDLTLEFSFYS
ncbi:hypothetical protein H7U19_12430 [Hyunsoonleella sp. SJ7]|uniref:Uncharacterized protein n=1 Tax=Hyunsoonleella aquatilis TaxID=2762758 RepID=A0A923KIU5_9FLAO|nr:hypothetical protein [Hyunsoonleella aquatilis]MBC3759219.1 hypothetical protein [Hyunsoonleella aquatilis]